MPRFMQWIISSCLALGVGSALVSQTQKMAQAAVHAHQHDQVSYSKFTKALLGAKPKKKFENQNQ